MIWNEEKECMSRDQMADLQGKQLVKLVRYMYRNVGYYRKKMKKLGLEPGGMETKLTAAQIATYSGADMVIANGRDVRVIHRIMEGRNYGTIFKANKDEKFNFTDFIDNLHR